jgi:hypothetical protein
METIKVDYTREELVAICERAVVPRDEWSNRDTPHTHEKLGLCWVMLKAGCPFHVHRPAPQGSKSGCHTDHETIWLTIEWPDFNDFEYGTGMNSQSDTFYLPTPKRLDERQGRDWY